MTSKQILIQLAFKHPVLIFFSIILGFSGAIFNGISTALIVPLLVSFFGKELTIFNNAPPILKNILSLFDSFPQERRLFAMFGAVLLGIILKNTTSYFSILVGSHLAQRIVNTLRIEGIRVILDVDLDYFSKNKIGDITNRINNEVSRIASSLKIITNLCSTVITIFVFLWFLIVLSWQLTIITTILLSLVALSNQYLVSRSRQYGKTLSSKSREYSNKLLEILTGIRLIKTVRNEEYEYQQIEKFILEREHAEFQSQANFALMAPIAEVLGIIAIFCMVLAGRYLFANEVESLSTILLTYLVILFRLLPFIGQLNNGRSQLANAQYGAEMATDFLRRDNKFFMQNGKVIYKKLEKEIKFENVDFAYPGSKQIVLKKIGIVVPKGKTIALVGSSGAGKSTIADLLPRFYDPISGRITIDGIDLRDYELDSLRREMGIVSQDTFLFNNSVRYNIAYGLRDVSEEEIIAATKRANAYEFIEKLPKGLDTEIGDRGVMLSGGQRQRIAIARALLRNPDILILDEATSALDTMSERLVQEAIEELCRERTTLVIAHRLSTIQKAHQIVVMEKGRVVEVGTHQQLVRLDGYYSRLYSLQFSDKYNTSKHFQPLNKAMLRAYHELRTRFSYEIRTNLNSMLGSLRLVTDNLVEDPEEQQELIEESYNSALRLLKHLEFYERKTPVESN
jgi:subfamily B ATP-binding cassette protein MsbA